MLTNIVALTAGLAATASAFDCNGHYFSFFNRAGPMSYQRLDPGLFPGVESPHLHSFDGGNGLSASMGFDTTQDSSCTTARIKPDKSLYWRPTLFFGNQTGFYRVPEKASKTYYKSGDGDKWANVTEFPEDFNMIAGDPDKRSDGNNAAGVRWGCHQPDGRDDKIFAPGFPTGFTSCAYGFASEVTFPSCWNGNKLDPKQPSAHMAYPTNGAGVGIENCPTTHRAARFPTIFMEFWYDISEFDGQYSADSAPWVLANGDPTGFGFHADFMNGWEKGVLAKATGETGGCNCGCGCGNDEMKQCFGADNVNDDNDASFKQCSASNSFDNLSSSHFDKLPGCNPIQSGPARATMASGAGCAAATGIAGSGSNSTATGTPASSAKATPTSGSYDDASSAVTSSSKDATTTSAAKSGSGNSNTDAKTTSSSTPKSSASPSYASVDLSNKGLDNAGGAGYEPVNPSEVAAKPTPSTPSNANNGKESDCKPTTTVTVTPTVYVTVGAQNATSTSSSVYKTLTKTAFVTLSASY